MYTVFDRYVSPGRRIVDGKFGWFGESGKCCVSRQKPLRARVAVPLLPSCRRGSCRSRTARRARWSRPPACGRSSARRRAPPDAGRSRRAIRSARSCGRSRCRGGSARGRRRSARRSPSAVRKSNGVPVTGAISPVGNQRRVDRRVPVGVSVSSWPRMSPRAVAGQVEVAVVASG